MGDSKGKNQRSRRTGNEYVFLAGNGICRQAGRDRTVENQISILLVSKGE